MYSCPAAERNTVESVNTFAALFRARATHVLVHPRVCTTGFKSHFVPAFPASRLPSVNTIFVYQTPKALCFHNPRPRGCPHIEQTTNPNPSKSWTFDVARRGRGRLLRTTPIIHETSWPGLSPLCIRVSCWLVGPCVLLLLLCVIFFTSQFVTHSDFSRCETTSPVTG